MEVFNTLSKSENTLIVKEIEKRNIITLQQTNKEIRELLKKVPTRRKHKIFYVKDHSSYLPVSHFPVDHRIVK